MKRDQEKEKEKEEQQQKPLQDAITEQNEKIKELLDEKEKLAKEKTEKQALIDAQVKIIDESQKQLPDLTALDTEIAKLTEAIAHIQTDIQKTEQAVRTAQETDINQKAILNKARKELELLEKEVQKEKEDCELAYKKTKEYLSSIDGQLNNILGTHDKNAQRAPNMT